MLVIYARAGVIRAVAIRGHGNGYLWSAEDAAVFRAIRCVWSGTARWNGWREDYAPTEWLQRLARVARAALRRGGEVLIVSGRRVRALGFDLLAAEIPILPTCVLLVDLRWVETETRARLGAPRPAVAG